MSARTAYRRENNVRFLNLFQYKIKATKLAKIRNDKIVVRKFLNITTGVVTLAKLTKNLTFFPQFPRAFAAHTLPFEALQSGFTALLDEFKT